MLNSCLGPRVPSRGGALWVTSGSGAGVSRLRALPFWIHLTVLPYSAIGGKCTVLVFFCFASLELGGVSEARSYPKIRLVTQKEKEFNQATVKAALYIYVVLWLFFVGPRIPKFDRIKFQTKKYIMDQIFFFSRIWSWQNQSTRLQTARSQSHKILS